MITVRIFPSSYQKLVTTASPTQTTREGNQKDLRLLVTSSPISNDNETSRFAPKSLLDAAIKLLSLPSPLKKCTLPNFPLLLESETSGKFRVIRSSWPQKEKSLVLGSHVDTFLRSFGVFILVKCCGSFNKFNTYFLRSLNSWLFFRLWIFYIIPQRGTHFCRLFYWSVRYTVTIITQIRDQLGNLTAKRTQQVSFDQLILI